MSCSSDSSPADIQNLVNTIAVNLGVTTLRVGQTVQAEAIARSASGSALNGVTLTWASSNNAVATVTQAGAVTGVAVGTATISASAEGKTASVNITVSAIPVSSVSVALSASSVFVGASGTTATATARDASGAVLTGRAITWSSSNQAVATINAAGIITPLTAGTTNIVATSDEGVQGSATLTVQARTVNSVTVALSRTTVLPAETATATATLRDITSTVLTGRAVQWSSSNITVATINASGNIVAVTPGTTTITGAAEGVQGTATLTVAPTVASIAVSFGGVAALTVGKTVTASAVLRDANNNAISGRGVTWRSSDQSIATVSSTGVVTGVRPGSVTITATNDGLAPSSTVASAGQSSAALVEVSGSATLTVQAAAANVTVSLGSSNVRVGLTTTATAVVRDAENNILARQVTWSSSNTGVATVDASGVVSGVTAGTANIQGRVDDATGAAAVIVVPANSGGGATPTQLVVRTQPAGAISGRPFATPAAVEVADANGTLVTGANNVITASIANGSGTITSGGAAVAVNGVATFNNLVIAGTGAHTLTFSGQTLTPATSASFNVTLAPATQLSITTQPSSTAQNGAAFAQQPVIQLRDDVNQPVSQAGVVVTAAISTGGGTLGGTTTATTNANGVATFSNLSITGTAGGRSLTFSAPGLTSVSSSNVSITPGAASQIVVTTQPSASAQTGVAFAQQPSVQIRDASGNVVPQAGVVVTAAIATGSGTLGGTTTASTNASGIATFTNLSITGLGSHTLGFSSTGLTAATSGSIAVGTGAASQLAITTQPSATAQSGVALATQPVIQLRDGSGNAVSQAGVVVTASIATGGGTLGGTTTATTNGSGVATFSGLSITGAAGNRTLAFSASGLTGATSGTIAVAAGAATQLAITTQPSTTAQSGVAFAQQPVIRLRDASGNDVAQAGVVVTAAVASGAGTLGGTTTATTNASGIATFTNLVITGAPGARTLTFTATGLTSATSGSIAVAAGAASQLAITTQPSTTAQSGTAFAQQPQLQLRDASGNAVSQAGVVVTATIASGGGTLGGTATATTNASGVAAYTNLSISGAAGDRTLTFSATGLTSATSGTITITASTATQLTITTQPSTTAQSGVAFAQQPVIQLRDGSGNAVSQAGVVVTASIATGGGTLGGTATATTNGSGVATFTNLSISGASGGRTLTFSATGLTSATSGTITVSASAATQLTITTQPSTTAQSGVAFAQQPVIQLRDGSGNAVSQAGVVVTAAIATGGGTLGGTTTATTNGSGVATFTNLSISGASGGRTLTFSATGLTSATSGTITVSASAATQLTITTQPSTTAQSGVAFAQQPVIQLRDGSGNAVSQSGVVVTASIATGGGTLGGTATATTNGSGVATFTNLSISGTAGARTLTFSATGLTSATSGSITVSAGAATKLAITTQPSATAQNGAALAQQPVVQLQDASNNAVSQAGVVVTATIATGGGTLGGITTATTDANGVATFTNLSITGTAGNRTLSFGATGLTSATSSAINITAGAASRLTVSTQPSNSVPSGGVFPQQPAVRLQDASGNNVSQSGVSIAVAIASGGGTLGGTATATTDANGIATFTGLSITGTAGSRTLSFTSTGLTSATSNSISISVGGFYPNRPAAFTQSSEIDFSQNVPVSAGDFDHPISGAPGWNIIFHGNLWSRVSDANATQSPPSIWQGHWQPGSYGGGVVGQGSGHGIGNLFNRASQGTNRLYMSMRIYMDFDAARWHSISNKFVNLEGNNSLILMQLKEGSHWRHAEELGASGFPSFFVDNQASAPGEIHIPGQIDNRAVPNRQWTQIEVLVDLPNRIFKIWQDGVLTTDATPTFASTQILTVGINAFRGGGGETLTTDLYYKYDHFFIAW